MAAGACLGVTHVRVWPQTSSVPEDGLLRKIDAVTVPVPDLDQGLQFYRDRLGHALLWRDDRRGQAGLRLPDADTEIVLTVREGYEPDWLVESAAEAAQVVVDAGGRIVSGPFDIPVGTVVVVADPFGNVLVLVDLSKGRYTTDADGNVPGRGV
jgi:predicted enzyme related to lactoylglutathione lyase